ALFSVVRGNAHYRRTAVPRSLRCVPKHAQVVRGSCIGPALPADLDRPPPGDANVVRQRPLPRRDNAICGSGCPTEHTNVLKMALLSIRMAGDETLGEGVPRP